MKKSYKLLALAILAGIAFSTTSCSKCRTCKLTYDNGTLQSETEICEDKDAMAQLKEDCQATAAADNTLKCSCIVGFSFQ